MARVNWGVSNTLSISYHPNFLTGTGPPQAEPQGAGVTPVSGLAISSSLR
jgi:hypothetical protein